MSPGVFVFSGPRLEPARSFDTSMSQFPSLSANSDMQPLACSQTKSFYLTDNTATVDEGILEPIVERGITRTMSHVLLGISTPVEETDCLLLSELAKDSERHDHTRAQDYMTEDKANAFDSTPVSLAVRAISALPAVILPYLDACA